jgi:hypothetical protein
MCREVVRILRTLKAKRDMTVNEARLIVSIEDPRTREQRQLGIEVNGRLISFCMVWYVLDLLASMHHVGMITYRLAAANIWQLLAGRV